VLHGLWVFYLTRAEMQTAHELAVQGIALANRLHDPISLVEAHHAMGVTFFYHGEYTSAQRHLEKGNKLYDSQPLGSHALVPSRDDPGVVCKSYDAHVLWLLGYPDKALQRAHTALTLARKLSHPYSIAFALISTTLVCLFRRETQLVLDYSDKAITISEEQGFSLWLTWATLYRGWALAENGQRDDGITDIRHALNFYQRSGTGLLQPHSRIFLSGAYSRVGKIEEGLAALAEAQIAIEKTGVGFLEAELYRTRGELLLMHGSQDEQGAETEFRKAIDISRRKQAKSLELRAAISMSRLWNRQGGKGKAKKLLSEVYGWFTEGFDTADLTEANSLLDDLS
jgi:predicted ATPase